MNDAPKLVWYFAYGANMMASVMVDRRGLRPLSSEGAHLSGFRLVFDLSGLPLVEPAFASIVEASDAEMYGVLYRLTEADMRRLRRSESPAYETIEVRVAGMQSGHIVAVALRNKRPKAGLAPSRRYVRLLCQGAREAALPEPYIAWLAAHPSAYVPVASEVTEAFFGAVLGLARRLRTARRAP